MTRRYYPPSLPTTQFDPIPQQAQTTYEDYRKIKGFNDVGYFLQAYVNSGGEATKDFTYNNVINVTTISASLGDSVLAREAASFKTSTPNTTYYLDFTLSGDWHWGTSHPAGSAGTEHLAIAEVTTDAVGNVDEVMDARGVVGGFRLKDEYGLFGYLGGVVDVRRYGAKGDGVFRKISEVFPSVTLSQVQALNSTATLDNSADWYAIQKAVIENKIVSATGHYKIDLPIVISINERLLFSNKLQSTIENVSNQNIDTIVLGGPSVVTAVTLSGFRIIGNRQIHRAGVLIRNCSISYVQDCYISGFEYGMYSAANNNVWALTIRGCRVMLNKICGIKIDHFFSHQKNAIVIDDCVVSHAGYNDLDQRLYDLNQSTTTFGHGVEISGTAISIVNSTIEYNSGAGIYLGGGDPQRLMLGINITGNYFEPNRLVDIYINNSVSMFLGNINGNYFGSDFMVGSVYRKYYFTDRNRRISPASNIENGSSFYVTQRKEYAMNSDLMLTRSSPSRNFGDFIIFDRGRYEITAEFEWNKVSPSSLLGFSVFAVDYDGNNIVKDTTAAFVQTPYATLVNDAASSDTVLTFDDLTGFDISSSSYNNIVIYNTVLSNGVSVGTDYSTFFINKSLISSINLTTKQITLTQPIGRVISSGTKVSLNGVSGSSAALVDYLYVTTPTTSKRSRVIDSTNLPYAKWIYYLFPFITLINATDNFDICKVKSFTYQRSLLIQSGSTAGRPTLSSDNASYPYYDTTLNKPIWWSGSVWRDATGTSV